MSTHDRDAQKDAAAQEPTLPVEDLSPKKVDLAKADAVKGGAATSDAEANSEKIKH